MPSRPDLRDIASHVKEAFAEMDRDALLDILTFVVKEYVVEGPPPMLVHQAETLADLQNLSFAQLVTALQTRFDFPELAMFVVDGEQVGVRIGGVVQPLIAQRTPPAGMQMIDTRQQQPPPQPGVRVVEVPVQQRPAQAAPAAAPAPTGAPPPSRGLSIRGRPSGEGEAPAPPPAQGAAPQPPPAQGQPPAAAEKSDKPEGSGDDASARFSLLELD
jgi:outer membrane biosynthesis protein TonB